MAKRPHLRNDRIYQIIGQVVCERRGEHFVCRDRAALRERAADAAAIIADGQGPKN